ncbi:hypothetical protein [Streptomyces purpureus]|uniref:hypothetical protein n=1 Tax=Streptomyces purpureus TaxID=1951 RepID=UPI00166F960C|nr:hypothetical protein [Streptomyces purpureus]
MDMVILVLSAFLLAGGCLLLFGLMCFSGERRALSEARELQETGVEVPAVLVALEPLVRTDTLRACYEYPTAGGSHARHVTGVGPNPLHVVGETYSLVRLPRVANKVHMGTMAAVRKERGDRERYVRHAVWMMVSGSTACAMAVTGLVLVP